MTINEYQEWTSSRLNPDFDNKETQMTGLTSEVGELMSERMRELRGDREAKGLDEIQSEIGDILFYLSNIAKLYGFTMGEIMTYNVDKLSKRKAKKH